MNLAHYARSSDAWPLDRQGSAMATTRDTGRLSAVRELALIAALFLAYKVARLAANGHVDEAFANARAIWDAERLLRLPGELAVQQALLGGEALIEAANSYYAYVHF